MEVLRQLKWLTENFLLPHPKCGFFVYFCFSRTSKFVLSDYKVTGDHRLRNELNLL